MAVPAETSGALVLDTLASEVLAEEAAAFARVLREPDARARYAELADAARQGSVPEQLVPALETMLELVLQTQRIRRQHGPAAEQALAELFAETPRGNRLRASAREVNRALQALRGQRIERLTVSPGVGQHTLSIETDACRVLLRLDAAAGFQVTSLEV